MDQNLIEAFRLQMQQRSGQDVGPTIAKHLPTRRDLATEHRAENSWLVTGRKGLFTPAIPLPRAEEERKGDRERSGFERDAPA